MDVVIFANQLKANVLGKKIVESTPTKLYVSVMIELLTAYPNLVGQKETHYTADYNRAMSYTGTTRECIIHGKSIYIKTGFSTKDKWKGIEKTCELVGITFNLYEGNIPNSNTQYEKVMTGTNKVNKASTIIHSDIAITAEQKFAYHSEFWRGRVGALKRDCLALSKEIAGYDGLYYEPKGNRIYEIAPNGQACYFEIPFNFDDVSSIAVNYHGIFIYKNKQIILLNTNGEIINKIKIQNPMAIYIYDNWVYVLN